MTVNIIVEGLEDPLVEGLTHCKSWCPEVPTSILDLAFYALDRHKLDIFSYLVIPIPIWEGFLTETLVMLLELVSSVSNGLVVVVIHL